MLELGVPPFLRDTVAILQAHEPGLWTWFSSAEFGTSRSDEVRLELLKSTYRLARDSHAEAYEAADRAARALGMNVPLTLFQAQDQGVMNAATWFVPDEVLVVLQGPVLVSLSNDELVALFGHELAHHHFHMIENGVFLTASALLEHVSADPRSSENHRETTRRVRRFSELYADRGSLAACGAFLPAVSCLIKVTTGLKEVDPSAYLRQADEVLAKSDGTDGPKTHPETFIRAHALQKWHQAEGLEREELERSLRRLVGGAMRLEALDLVEQKAVEAHTRVLLDHLFSEPWFVTDATLAHARRFFADFVPRPPAAFRGTDLADYYAFVLLDFAVVDPELEDAALAHVVRVAETTALVEPLQKLATKELKLSAKAFSDLRARAEGLVAEARAQVPAETAS